LIEATIRTADGLRDLWASPKGKEALRRRNRRVEVYPSYPENTDILDEYLQGDDDDEDVDLIPMAVPEVVKNLKRKHGELDPYDEIIVEDEPMLVDD
jgi:hypothetical protein